LYRDDDPEILEEKANGNSSGTFAVLELNSLTRFYFGGVPSTVMVTYVTEHNSFFARNFL